jgi:hypothetical protein
MIWINIKTTTLRESEYISASPTQQATWLKLLAYCSEHENGGVIDGAGGWNERAWLFGCGITLEEVRDQCGLWRFDGTGSLSVWNYPVEKELEVVAKREAGKRGGQAKAQNRSTACSSATAQPVAQLVAETGFACSSPPTEGVRSKGKEEGVKEREISLSLSSSAAPIPENEGGSVFPIEPPPPKPKREPKAKPETTADPRLKPIKDGLAPVFEKIKGREFDCDWKKTVGAIRRFLESRSKVTPDEFLEVWSLVCKYSSSPFYPKITDALDVAYLCRNYETVTGHIERAYHSESQAKR